MNLGEIIDCPYIGSTPAISYLENRLSQEDRERYEAHLQVCDLCRGDLASSQKIKKLIEDYEKEGSSETTFSSAHFSAEEIWNYFLGRLSDFEALRFEQHLSDCDDCSQACGLTKDLVESGKRIMRLTDHAVRAH